MFDCGADFGFVVVDLGAVDVAIAGVDGHEDGLDEVLVEIGAVWVFVEFAVGGAGPVCELGDELARTRRGWKGESTPLELAFHRSR